MPPKKASTAAKKTGAASSHPPYQDMIKEAVINLKERNGSSRQALKKYVQANNNLSGVTDATFTNQFNKALQKGSDSGVFARPKGASGPVKLAAPGTKAADSKPAAAITKSEPTKKATTTKRAATKKTAAPKKAAATKTAAKKAPAKKTAAKPATKTKANTSKTRKTQAPAPAVEDKPPVVLGKTKSGRVTKTKQPVAEAKRIVTKKAATKKAPAKKATPKKA